MPNSKTELQAISEYLRIEFWIRTDPEQGESFMVPAVPCSELYADEISDSPQSEFFSSEFLSSPTTNVTQQ